MSIAFRTSTRGDATEKLAQVDLAQPTLRGLHEAVGGWAHDRRGLGARLASDAMARFGFHARSSNYTTRVIKAWGKYMPFVSPRRSGYGGVGKFLYSLTVPGKGHTLIDGSRSDSKVEVVLSVPSPRGLNFKAGNGVYLEEWCRQYPFEDAEIEKRMADQIGTNIEQKLGAA